MEQTSRKRIGFFDLWKNPEAKNTVRLFLFSLLLFIIMVDYGTFYLTQQFKNDYIESNAAITGALLEQHPELEGELVTLLTKDVSDDEKRLGMDVLSEYGITPELSMEFFPEMTEFFRMITGFFIISLLLFFISLFLLHYQFSTRMFTRIRELTRYADEVLEGRAVSSLPEFREGDFSKLIHSFNRMRFVIQKNIADLKKEKRFLVNLMSDISHQLKTPLAALTMYNDLMAEKELSKEQQDMFLEQGRQQLERMNWLIQSLLKLAKLDVGAIQFQKRNASLTQTVLGSVEILKELSVQKGVQVEVKAVQECFMKHDADWMTEALLNVLKNAIEHTPSGKNVSITLEESKALTKVHIWDQGDGIERGEVKNIFKRFYKGKKNKKSGSVGIGLSLSKSIVEGHNGIIQVESKIGEGTTFTFVFAKDSMSGLVNQS
ncbi:signal transduction histidine kinase [Bacillus pakistanensis]|uniref:histidine kinase n=1 Tax=Rossellomorea pakistanensis TaxID=992288 RepID=A0ABS2NJ03_9BACI|nr:HAMP domain-containing sensor histidine kinase [Bacillus pakistanensis]MBM7587785.1 signal transduction histidine kinase [Bacillus pakistanensis]